MRNKTILRFAATVLPVLLYVTPTTDVQAKDSSSFGPAVDAYCQPRNGQRPFADQGCALCHVSNLKTRVTPEWDWYNARDYAQFCPDQVNNAPNGTITAPAGDRTVMEGDRVLFQGTGSDPDGHTPLGYSWDFGGAAPASTQQNPGEVTFSTAGVYLVRLWVSDSLGLTDPTPAQRRITVEAPAPVCSDDDGDGSSPDGGACGPVDCDDRDPAVNPGAEERCSDGIDNNCNALVDEDDPGAVGCPVSALCSDLDGDGFSFEGGYCGPTDCDDGDASVNPGAPEACGDGFDNDCDGLTDSADTECDGSDCIGNLIGGSEQVRIGKAVWRVKLTRLLVGGDGVPVGETVLIRNAYSLEPIATAIVNKKGIWVYRANNPTNIPCAVMAEYGDSTDTQAVARAPTDCDMGTNAPPVASDDSYGIAQQGVLLVGTPGVLGNDTDPDGDTLEAILIQTAAHGSLSLRPDGGFEYRPDAGFSGTDGFTYQASDGDDESGPARVTLDVQAAPEPEPELWVDFRDVRWKSGDRKLIGKGTNAPSKTTLEILDADTAQVLGSVKTEDDGKFEIELKLPSAPCRIQGRHGGKTSAPHPVQYARCSDDDSDDD